MRITCENVLLDGPDGPRIAPATLEVHGTDLVAVAAGRDPSADVDLGASRLLGPALVNAHTHLSMGAFRGAGGRAAQRGNVVEELYFRLERDLAPEDVRAFTRMGAWDCLLAGTGAVIDQYYHGDQVAEALVDVGLCGLVAPTLQDLAGPGRHDWARALESTEAIATDARLAAAGVVAGLGPHATDTVSDALWARLLPLAERLGLPLHVHVGQSLEEVERAFETHGCSPVQRLRRVGALDAPVRGLLVHMLLVDEADLAALDPARHTLGYCPRSQAQFAFPAPVAAWRAAGLPFVIGTDAGVCNDTMNVQQDLTWAAGGASFAIADGTEHAALRAGGGLGAARAVEAARQARFDRDADLSDPGHLLRAVGADAGAVHPGLRVGRIAAGMRANLAAWDLDHPALWPATDPLRALVYGDAGAALHSLMVNGRWIGAVGDVRGAILRSEAYRAHRAEADARLKALLARV